MKDIIDLKSRNHNNYLKKMKPKEGGESFTYLLKVESTMLRAGYTNDKKYFIDPAGGPMIVKDSPLKQADGAIVKSIDHIEGYGIVITFKEPNDS